MSAPELTTAQPPRQLGNVIRHLRMRKGRRGNEFARAVGLAPQTYYNYESEGRQAGWITLYAIARELGVPVTRIVRDPRAVPDDLEGVA